jgi:hypothetical protein
MHLLPSLTLSLWVRKVSVGRRSTTYLHGAQFRFPACNTARLFRLIDQSPLSRLHEMRFAAAYEENDPLTLTIRFRRRPNH